MFNPHNWYWIKADGSVYSSSALAFISSDDEAFSAWKAEGNIPTPYPWDIGYVESEAELAAVLIPYGIFVRLSDYAAAKRYTLENGGFTYQGHLIATDRDSQSKIGNAALAATVTGESFSTRWKDAQGIFFDLDHAGVLAMATAVMAFVNGCFGTEAAIAAEIEGGTIKTKADVDAAAWPVNSL